MRRRHGKRAKLSGVLLVALGALALLAIPSIAAAKDSNGDRLPDRWEKQHKLSLKVKQGARDQDRDHLTNRGEFRSGMNPRDRDSDNDGVKDGDENAGTIASFDSETGKLVINLYGGDTISGIVTDETRIKCGDGCDRSDDDGGATASHEGNSGPSENSGSGGDDDPADHDQNDDNGGGDDDPANHDAGDDHGHHGDDDGVHHGGDNSATCTTDALVEGAVVDEAELELRDGKAVFEEIELEETEQTPQA